MRWLCSAKVCSVWVHRTVSGGAPDSVRWCRQTQANSPLSGSHQRRTTIIHRTVRCAPDCPVSQRSVGQTVGREIRVRHVVEPTVGRGHRTCPVRQRLSGCQRSTAPFLEGNRAPDSVRCAPDCPVRPTTEGKDGLPDVLSTSPSCLGAIKGTPRRMEEYIKYTQSNPKHRDFDSTHLVHCDSI